MTSYEEVHQQEDGTRKVQVDPPKRQGAQAKKLAPEVDDSRPIANVEDRRAIPGCEGVAWTLDGDRWRLTRRYGNRSWGDAIALLGSECRLNLRGRNIEVRIPEHQQNGGKWVAEGLTDTLQQKSPNEWHPVSDVFERELRERHAEFFYVLKKSKPGESAYVPHSLSAAEWQDQRLLHLASNQYDAMAEYLRDLPKWDGEDRLTSLLHDTIGAKQDDVVAQWVMRGLLIGAVARANRPGHPHDWLPVLIGKQGIGKSLLLQSLVPDGGLHREFEMTTEHKHVLERSAGAVICEWSELKSSRNTSLESVKDCISRSKDIARLAYDRNTTVLQRMWVFAATANDPGRLGVLPPDDEHRRFLVVQCGVEEALRSGVASYVGKVRDQLWAQALHEYKAFVPSESQRLPNLPSEATRQAAHLASGASIRVSHWIEGKSHMLKNRALLRDTQAGPVEAWSAERIVEVLHEHNSDGLHLDVPALAPQALNYAIQQVADMLRKSGWERRQFRTQAGRMRLWVPPAGWFGDDSWMDDEKEE